MVRQGDQIFAYENSCPHTGGPLDWTSDQFLDEAGQLVVCATHLTLFRIDDGRCIGGPCAGASLRPVKVAVIDGAVLLAE